MAAATMEGSWRYADDPSVTIKFHTSAQTGNSPAMIGLWTTKGNSKEAVLEGFGSAGGDSTADQIAVWRPFEPCQGSARVEQHGASLVMSIDWSSQAAGDAKCPAAESHVLEQLPKEKAKEKAKEKDEFARPPMQNPPAPEPSDLIDDGAQLWVR